MWPTPGEALSHTIDAEAAVADLYAEALRRWAPHGRAAVLPSLDATVVTGESGIVASTLPPDPDALERTQSIWDEIAEAVILGGLGLLWAVTFVRARRALGLAVPESGDVDEVLDTDSVPVDASALSIVARAADATPTEVREAAAAVRAVAAPRQAVEDFTATRRQVVSATLGVVRKTVSVAVAAVPETMAGQAAAVRAVAADVLDPDSQHMRDIARNEGYQAAGVMNHAVVEAARGSDEELEKTWICTIDGKTRPTHWAADGQRVPLDGKFTIGTEQLAYPGDESAHPREWKNCRCRVGILAPDEPLPDEVDRHTERLDGRDSVVIHRQGRTQAEEIERRAKAGNVRARDDEDGIGRVASAGWTALSEQEYDMVNELSADADDTSNDETFLTFTDALFAVTGVPTSDGRMLSADIDLSFRDTPMPLQWCEEMEGGHHGSVTVGVIESIALKDGEVRASGYLLNNEHAVKAIDLIAHGVCNPSVDLGSVEWVATDEDGNVVTEENYEDGMTVYMTVTKAEVLATTIVAIPAFGETRIALNEEREHRDKTLVASAEGFRPRVYDPQMFADPQLSGPTPIQMDPETGRVFGHVACWAERHRSVGLGHMHPPRSKSGYEHFHSSPPVHLSDGTLLPVGRLTVGTGHADTRLGPAAAAAHYDNTGACWALVRAGEDTHGIWVSGVVAPWATPEQVEMGLASPLSGDWRPFGRDLELVAVLSVNTPGFLCRGSTDSRGNPTALVASLSPRPGADASAGHLTLADIKAAMAEAIAEERRNHELAQRRAEVLARAEQSVGAPPKPPTHADRVAALLERI